MESIKQLVDDAIKNHAGVESKTEGKVRMSIWTGPCMDKVTGKVYQSKGYYKDTHSVFAVPKYKFNAFLEDRYYLRPDELRETAAKILVSNTITEYLNRVFKPKSVDKPDDKEVVGKPYITNKGQDKKLVRLLTFFNKEVFNCTVIPGGTSFLPGGVPDPRLHDVEANVLNDGVIDYRNVSFIHSPYVKRETINVVPRGGGVKLRETQAHSLTFNPGEAQHDSSRNAGLFTQDQYANPYCFLYDKDVSIDGDLWFEGLKTSLSRGIYEVWTDDIGAGPMLRASRSSVYEAAARYYKDINPTNLRYNGYRVNPAATILSSNAVTPVKTYVEDILGDPTFYAGIFAVLNQLLAGFNNDSDNVNKYIDLGSFDYNTLYNNKLGAQI